METQFHRAFWDILDQGTTPEHLRSLMDELVEALCKFVPRRTDIHDQIKKDFEGEVDWDTQIKLLDWIEKFQAPIYDSVTRDWKKKCPEPVGQFLKKYYEHVEKMYKQIKEYKPTIRTGR